MKCLHISDEVLFICQEMCINLDKIENTFYMNLQRRQCVWKYIGIVAGMNHRKLETFLAKNLL